MDSDGRPGGRSVDADTPDARDPVDYPKVVLVTGACRFLGGYLTARLAQNPLINHVIAVDAIAPSKDLLRRMGRAEFVRAEPRVVPKRSLTNSAAERVDVRVLQVIYELPEADGLFRVGQQVDAYIAARGAEE